MQQVHFFFAKAKHELPFPWQTGGGVMEGGAGMMVADAADNDLTDTADKGLTRQTRWLRWRVAHAELTRLMCVM